MRPVRSRRFGVALGLLAALAGAACSTGAGIASGTLATTTTASSTSTTAPPTTPPTTTTAPTTTSTTTTTTTTTPATTITLPPATVPPATVPPPPPTAAGVEAFLGEETIGTSVDGRPIVVSHYGTAGGTPVLVVGVIHGNENAGVGILDLLRGMPVPGGIDLWLMDAMNPDGYANDVRGNGNQVDLNRNFPHDWTQIGEPGLWEYSGSGPASEPETQAFIAFAERIKPALTLWYHQDLYRISPSKGADKLLRERYAQITGLPIISVTGGTYTGVAATWVRTKVPAALSFIIELGPTLSAGEAQRHAKAVLEVATMV